MSVQDKTNSVKHSTMKLSKYSKIIFRPKVAWNERFHVMITKDNQRLHLFYKELFSKPSHVKQEEVLLNDKSQPAFLFGTSYTPFGQTANSKTMRKTMSQDQLNHMTLKESKWVDNFSIMGSKNNDRVHRHYQEYFDRPIDYDNQGYKLGILRFSEISPSKIKKFRNTLRKKSPGSLNRRLQLDSQYGVDDKEEKKSKHQNSPKEAKDNEKQDEHEASEKEIKNSETIQRALSKQRRQNRKRRYLRRSMENEPDKVHYGSIPNLRTESKRSQVSIKKELGWKKIGDPISTYNQLVHPAYRIGFDRL